MILYSVICHCVKLPRARSFICSFVYLFIFIYYYFFKRSKIVHSCGNKLPVIRPEIASCVNSLLYKLEAIWFNHQSVPCWKYCRMTYTVVRVCRVVSSYLPITAWKSEFRNLKLLFWASSGYFDFSFFQINGLVERLLGCHRKRFGMMT